MLYKFINIEHCTACDGVGVGDPILKNGQEYAILHKFKEANSNFEKKIEPLSFHCLQKESHKG